MGCVRRDMKAEATLVPLLVALESGHSFLTLLPYIRAIDTVARHLHVPIETQTVTTS